MSKLHPRNFFRISIETVGLQTPRGRLLFFAAVTVIVFLLPYESLAGLSLWERLGIPSPSIGLTRAYWKLIHFDPIGAYERNKLIYLVIAIGLPLLVRDVYRLWYNRKGLRTHKPV